MNSTSRLAKKCSSFVRYIRKKFLYIKLFKLVILAPRHSSGLPNFPSKVIGAYCTTTDAGAESNNLQVRIQSPPNHNVRSCKCTALLSMPDSCSIGMIFT